MQGVNLVIDNFYVASDTSPLYKIWKQSNKYLWRYPIFKFGGYCVVWLRTQLFQSSEGIKFH